MVKANKKLAVLLALTLVIAMFVDFSNIYAEGGGGTPRDITNLIHFKEITLKGSRENSEYIVKNAEIEYGVKKDGETITEPFVIKKNYRLWLTFNWDVKDGEALREGDYFEFQVTDVNQQHIKIINDFADFDVKVKDSDKVIGKATSSNGKLKVTINENGTHNRLKDGYFKFHLQVVSEGNDILLPIGNNVKITVKPQDPSSGGPSSGVLGGDLQPTEKLTKYGENNIHGGAPDKIEWYLSANLDQLSQMMAKQPVTERKKVYIEDKIIKKMTLLEPVEMRALIKIPNKDDLDKISKSESESISSAITLPPVEKNVGNETYEAFKTRLINMNRPVIGIYNPEKDPTVQEYEKYSAYLIAAWGDSPGTTKDGTDKLTYYDVTGGKVNFESKVDNLKNAGKITEDQATRMKEVYGGADGNGAPIVGFRVKFKATVPYNGQYPNTATMYWETDQVSTSPVEAKYNGQSGSVGEDSREITVNKQWKDVDGSSPLDPSKQPDEVTVKLLRKGLDGNFQEMTGKTLTLKKLENWMGKFKNIDRYYAGNVAEYKVGEVSVAGYTSAVVGTQDAGFTITNTKKPKTPSGGGSKPKPDPEKPPVKPDPEKPPTTPPTTPETSPTTPPTTPETPPSRPVVPRDDIPDPNDPESPNEITIIDENGVPLGNYRKQQKPDGTFEYVIIDEEVPLAGGYGQMSYYLAAFVLIAAGNAVNVVRRKKQKKIKM